MGLYCRKNPVYFPFSCLLNDHIRVSHFFSYVLCMVVYISSVVPGIENINKRMAKNTIYNTVDRQRQQYRYRQEGQKSHMDDQRIAILEREGFVWSFYELRWELQYDELVQYKEKFGNCVVPIDAPEYEKLWTWVFKQKRTYSMRKRGEPSPITDERIEKLEKIGFIWDLFEDLWIMRLTELREYKAYHGDW